MELVGHLSNYSEANRNQNIPDSFSIKDWDQYNVGSYTKKTAVGTIYDFGTTFIENRYVTLGDLRKYIEEKYK